MFVTDVKTGKKIAVVIEAVVASDYPSFTKKRFWFDWKLEKQYEVYKLRKEEELEIWGLISVEGIDSEKRIEIRLLAAGKENTGTEKQIEGIAGCLLAFAGKLALERYGANAAISLMPKTLLRSHYIIVYGFMEAGIRLFLTGQGLFSLVKKYGL